jgi:hypothetical protein
MGYEFIMKHIILSIFILQATCCLGQKVKRRVQNPGPTNDASVSQIIYEYDTLGRKIKEILTSNEDTLEYQYEQLFFYNKSNKLKIVIYNSLYDNDGVLYTIYYYDKKNFLYKSQRINSEEKLISYRLYKQNQWTEYTTSEKKKPIRVQTAVHDSIGNILRLYGWEKNRDGKRKWDYKYVNEYSPDRKLIKTEMYDLDGKLVSENMFEYNQFGLITKEIFVPEKGKYVITGQFRYEYY